MTWGDARKSRVSVSFTSCSSMDADGASPMRDAPDRRDQPGAHRAHPKHHRVGGGEARRAM